MTNELSTEDLELIQHEIKMDIVKRSKESPDGYYGDLSGVNVDRYDPEQLNVLSLGRGTCPYIACVDDLDPRKYPAEKMLDIGGSRATKQDNVYTFSFGR